MRALAGAKGKNYPVAQAFAEIDFWKPEYEDLFSKKLTMEFPFAPPGWLMRLSVSETKAHMEWLQKTVKNWKWSNVTVYGTNFPDTFIYKRDGAGDVHWAGKDGRFESRFITIVTIEDEKITHIKDYFSLRGIMAAIGFTDFPVVDFSDAPPIDEVPVREPVPYVADDPEKLAKRTYDTLKKFVEVDFWDVEDCINANDIVHELPFTLPDEPAKYNAREYDQLNLWLAKRATEWITYPEVTLYETDEEGTYFIESGGLGRANWTGTEGVYQQRELSFLHIEDGYAKEFHEYFNPMNKINSGLVSIPTFPYLF